MELTEQEREELMACEFVVKGNMLINEPQGRLVDIDPDIGFTIIDKNNTDRYLCCLHGLATKKNPTPQDLKNINALFEMTITGIQEGVVDLDKIESHLKNNGSPNNVGYNASSETCAFNR